ncbi:RDD family protein [Alteromonas sp. ASW11-19]|uniref:RDD family protein n=1 Tax=Alteromonas salexigens TaxID=2982530 RepID=A0ABT2VKG3_9ALTE|nr:RDD family protein [Alteromonas salexigens]MCU7553776.1 RDD family protein [Alteromonas salexigens]
MENAPEFQNYTYDELLDVRQNIDREQFPERYSEVNRLIANKQTQRNVETGEELTESDKYHTFWPRCWAALVDGIIFAIVIYIECLLFGIDYAPNDSFLQALNAVQLSIYLIFMHGIFGQSFGKMLLGVKVVNVADEKRIGICQAGKRESVTLILNAVWAVLIVLVAIDLELYNDISPFLLGTFTFVGTLSVVWALSEFITMLFNKKRRALHDFIGGTVVVRT